MRLVKLRGQDGFSMVEVLITLMVISAAFISLSSLSDTTNSFAGKGSINAYATDALNKFATFYDNQNLANTTILNTIGSTSIIYSNPLSNSGPFVTGGAGIEAVTALSKLPTPATAEIKVCYVDTNVAPSAANGLGAVSGSTFGTNACTNSTATNLIKKVSITVKYGSPTRSRNTTVLLAKAVDGGNH